VLYKNNSDTSRDGHDIRIFSARMGHGAVNKLIGGTIYTISLAPYSSSRKKAGQGTSG
jgi:hypothetical protein